MYELPSHWVAVELGEVATFSPKSDVSDLAENQLVHFVPMAAVAENFAGIDTSQFRPFQEVRKGYKSFAEGDVLFAKITPCMENGKGGVVPPLPQRHAFGSTEFHVVRPGAAVMPAWLAHFLSQPLFRRIARQNMTGSAGQLRVPTKWLASVKTPVAPLAEQTRIVAKLEELPEHFVCQSVALLRLTEPVMSEFINAVLNSQGHGQRQFREMNYGAGRPHLSFDQIESVLVPFPPLGEQEQITKSIECALTLIGEIEASISRAFQQSAAQRQNLLKAAFSGQLVPQDPADEPASALLERIRNQAAAPRSARKAGGNRRSPSKVRS